jgi:hypothetical protein
LITTGSPISRAALRASVGVLCHDALRHRNAEAAEDLLGLIFV